MFIALYIAQLIGKHLAFPYGKCRNIGVVMPILDIPVILTPYSGDIDPPDRKCLGW
jgi:hypothetical protein